MPYPKAFKRKEIKKESRPLLRRHYFRTVIMAFLVLFTVAGTFNSSLLDFVSDSESGTNFTFLLEIVRFYVPDFLTGESPSTLFLGLLLASLCNTFLAFFTFPLAIASRIYATGFENATQIFYVLFFLLLYVAFIFFVLNPLHVGSLRYFLEKGRGNDGKNYLFSAFGSYYKNVVLVKLYQFFLTALWSLTIVMIPVKYYEYSQVDYILSENPSLSPQNAILLSKELTRGHKWQLFLLDLSFLGYNILSLFTLGLLDALFTNPYKEIAKGKAYDGLKAALYRRNLLFALNYDIVNPRNKEGILLRREVDYDCPYSFADLILIFFVVSFIGWCWEVLLHLVQDGTFVNRGTLWGPYLPIYGTGGVVVLLLLKGTRGKPILSFFLSIAICLTIEYFTGWFLETFRGLKYWDYSDMPFNLHGRICLYGGLVFGMACILMIYVVGPFLYQLLSPIPGKVKWGIGIALIAVILVDAVVSHFYPNQGEGITTPAKAVLRLFLPLS